MILEQYFRRTEELKTATAWKKAIETREVQRNSFRVSGDVKQAREFALAVMQQREQPAPLVEIIEEVPVVPTIVFARA